MKKLYKKKAFNVLTFKKESIEMYNFTKRKPWNVLTLKKKKALKFINFTKKALKCVNVW